MFNFLQKNGSIPGVGLMKDITLNGRRAMVSNKENTFNLLKKLTFEQIRKEFQSDTIRNMEDRDKWCRARGWTREEYFNELDKRPKRAYDK